MVGRGRTAAVIASVEDNPVEMPVDYFCNILFLADAYLSKRSTGFQVVNATPRINLNMQEYLKLAVENFTKLG